MQGSDKENVPSAGKPRAHPPVSVHNSVPNKHGTFLCHQAEKTGMLGQRLRAWAVELTAWPATSQLWALGQLLTSLSLTLLPL